MAPAQTDRRLRLPRVFSGLWPEARLRPRRPCGLPHGLGVKGSIRLAPAQTDRRSRLPRVFSGLWPEARHTPRRPCGLPHGLGVSDPSPCAPPRQAGKPGPIGHRAHVVLGSRPKQRPSLLGLSARSALTRDARAGCASRARGQRPLPVCPTPASWEARPDRALCSGVLRRGLGRAGGACLGKKQVGAGTDMRVPSAQPKAGTLPGDT